MAIQLDRKDDSHQSVWGNPNRSYYHFLNLLEQLPLPRRLCILGCSDGKFVVPAARAGFEVLAIDIDAVAIDRMRQRLDQHHLTSQVEVVVQSFLDYQPRFAYTGVFTSGSIHYIENAQHPLPTVISTMQNYVAPGGYLFQEYIHTSPDDNDPQRHFVTKDQMSAFFVSPEWLILKHRKKRYCESPNPRNPREHFIVWGSILARRSNNEN